MSMKQLTYMHFADNFIKPYFVYLCQFVFE